MLTGERFRPFQILIGADWPIRSLAIRSGAISYRTITEIITLMELYWPKVTATANWSRFGISENSNIKYILKNKKKLEQKFCD